MKYNCKHLHHNGIVKNIEIIKAKQLQAMYNASF